MGDDKLKRDQTSADGKEKARQVWNDEAGNARRLQFAHFADEKRGLAVCEQLQAFWAGNNLRPSARFALLTDDAARELAGILLAHFPYNNQGGGKYAPRAAKTAERAKATASKGIAALATLKKKGEAVEVDEEQRRLMLEIAGVPAAEIDKLLAKGKKAKAKA